MSCSPVDAPLVRYPQGATLPELVITLPGGGDLSLFDSLELRVTLWSPDGGPATTIPTGAITPGTDTATCTLSTADIGGLDPGTYGLTFIAHAATDEQKWTGYLEITPAA